MSLLTILHDLSGSRVFRRRLRDEVGLVVDCAYKDHVLERKAEGYVNK